MAEGVTIPSGFSKEKIKALIDASHITHLSATLALMDEVTAGHVEHYLKNASEVATTLIWNAHQRENGGKQ